ncbi:MAG: RNA-binding protein [Bacteroidetes bacterium]|nr:MAG: RNA-binding protein [Bacteroidota bacterium]
MKLFVKNIHPDVNELELEGIFAVYGEIISAKIVYDRADWSSKGFGFVAFAKKPDALKAIEAMNNKEHRGKPLIVVEAVEKKSRFDKC